MLTSAADAESVVALRTLPAQSVVGSEDVTLVDAAIEGALTDIALALGQELRVTVYAGRPLRAQDIGPPALVDRNQTVTLIYRAGSLHIAAEGRALDRGGAGAVIRVMNLASRTTVSGRVSPDGHVIVGDLQ